MKRKAILLCCLALLLLTPGCRRDPMRTQRDALSRNRQRWQQQNLTSYRFTLQIGCFCPPAITQPVQVEVRNGAVASITRSSPEPVDRSYFEPYATVEQLFGVIERAIADRPAQLDVEYDPTLGYPRRIYVDQSRQIVDEERALTITNLEAIR